MKTGKILLVWFLVLILMSSVVACGKSAPAASETQSSAVSTAAQSTAAGSTDNVIDPSKLDFVTLNWYMPPPGDVSNQATVEAAFNKILKEKLNAELHFNFLDWGSYENKMNVMTSAGEAWDIAMTASWINKVTTNVNKGAFLPLDDLLQKYGQHILKAYPEKYWPAVTYNGKKMAIANYTGYSNLGGGAVLKSMADKYSLDVTQIKTLADLDPFLAQVKKNEPGITPLMANGQTYPLATTFKNIDSVTSSIVYNIDTNTLEPFYKNQVTLNDYKTLADFYKKGYIAKDAALKKDYVAESKSQKYAVFPPSGGIIEGQNITETTYGFPCYEIVQKPAPVISTASVQTVCDAIGKDSKNPERAMMLMDLMWSDKELFNTICWGVEGQDYTVTSGKGTPDQTIELNKEMKWVVWGSWIANEIDMTWPNSIITPAMTSFRKNMNENGVASPLLGFVFDPEPVKTEVAQLDAIFQEAQPILFTGSAPDVDKYLADIQAKMDKAGFAKVQAEIEKQIAAWKAANGK